MVTAWGVFAASGCIVAVAWLERHHRSMCLSENEFWAAMWTLVLGGIVGAKALFVVLGWQHYASGELEFWADFGTGFVFFGGLAGALLAGLLFARLRRVPFANGADYFAVAAPLGHAIGRIGCWLEGCCHGIAGHPVQLYEAVGLLVIAWVGKLTLERIASDQAMVGDAFRLYLASYAVLRFVLDPLRADGRPERYFGLSYPQYIALSVIAAVLIWRYCVSRGDGASESGELHRENRA